MPEAATFVRYETACQVVHRKRRSFFPAVPQKLKDVDSTLEKFNLGQRFNFRKQITVPNNQEGGRRKKSDDVLVIFGTQSMIDRANRARELFIDGTFKARPCKPESAQLIMIHMRHEDVGVPILWILASSKTKNLYEAIWRYLLEEVPGLQRNLRCIVSDFEEAIYRSVESVMPDKKVRGCWFHFKQTIQRYWKKLGLKDIEEIQFVRLMTENLPLLPAEKIWDGIVVIAGYADWYIPNHQKLGDFIMYLLNYWGERIEIISVADSPVRTNNLSEGFNHVLPRKLGGTRPSFWRFLVRVGKYMQNKELLWKRLENGIPVQEKRKRKQVKQDRFLRRVRYRTENLVEEVHVQELLLDLLPAHIIAQQE